MTTKYKVEIETSTDVGHTETEFETHDWNELQRFLDLAGVAAEQAPDTVEDHSDEYADEYADPYSEEYMDEDHLETVTYDFTDDQPADYYETPADEYDMIDYSELDPYNDESVYENEGGASVKSGKDDPVRGPSAEKTADQLVRSAGSVEDAVAEAYDTYKHTKNKHWLAVVEHLKRMQDVNEAIDPNSPAGQVESWLRQNGYKIRYKDKGKTGRSFKLKSWYVDDPKDEGAQAAHQYKEELEDAITQDFPEAQVKLTRAPAPWPGAITQAWSVRVSVPHEIEMFEDDEDRDDAAFDYGNREVRRQKGRVSQGKQIDGYDYKGREEAGMQRGTPTQYGNNPMQSLQSSNDDLEESDELDENCGCQQEYSDTGIQPNPGHDPEHGLPYGYETDSGGNVVIFNNDNGCSVFLTGEDAMEVLAALEQNVEDPRTQQVVMRQYNHMMEDHEKTLQRQLRETYKQMVRNLN